MNDLKFKYVGQEIKKIILENKDREIIVIDAPLLYEGGFEKICNYVIAVVAEEKTKIKRIMQRDKIHPNQASQRISTQKNEDFYKEHADFIIENNENTRYITLVKETLKIVHTIKDEANKAE
jgi:dephospho-CoA kinase